MTAHANPPAIAAIDQARPVTRKGSSVAQERRRIHQYYLERNEARNGAADLAGPRLPYA